MGIKNRFSISVSFSFLHSILLLPPSWNYYTFKCRHRRPNAAENPCEQYKLSYVSSSRLICQTASLLSFLDPSADLKANNKNILSLPHFSENKNKSVLNDKFRK